MWQFSTMKRLLLLFALCAQFLSHAAEVIPVTPIEKCFLCSSTPSLTMYFQGTASKAVVMFIPGGEGYIGLKEGQTNHRYHLFQTLKRLTDPTLTSGQWDVVLLDSPTELSPRQHYPAARGASDHLIRIESAIRFYKEKTGLPVWLMGHSNGGISLTHFLQYAQKKNKLDLIGGMIPSGIRNESNFEAPIPFPVLFLHHQNDGCSHTMPSAAQSLHERVKKVGTAAVDFAFVTSGEPEARDPCRSGHHMYFGAGEETAKAIDAFMSANVR
jgi:pimeloyl-ACP methyl ester carboxylesterase